MMVDKKLIINKLKIHLNLNSDSELAEFLGVKQNTISTWKSRNTLDYELIITKCDNINANWLITGEPPMLINENNFVSEPRSEYLKDKIIKLQDEKIQKLEEELNAIKRPSTLPETTNK